MPPIHQPNPEGPNPRLIKPETGAAGGGGGATAGFQFNELGWEQAAEFTVEGSEYVQNPLAPSLAHALAALSDESFGNQAYLECWVDLPSKCVPEVRSIS